jgi:hypothetical protein
VKGRVERAHKTLQDRLVKELRLAGARTLAEGNALLPRFTADYNTRFAKPPANKKDLHRAFGPATIWRMRLPGRRSAPSRRP